MEKQILKTKTFKGTQAFEICQEPLIFVVYAEGNPE